MPCSGPGYWAFLRDDDVDGGKGGLNFNQAILQNLNCPVRLEAAAKKGGGGSKERDGTSREQGTGRVREATQVRGEGGKRESKTAGGEKETFLDGGQKSRKNAGAREKGLEVWEVGNCHPCPTEEGIAKWVSSN